EVDQCSGRNVTTAPGSGSPLRVLTPLAATRLDRLGPSVDSSSSAPLQPETTVRKTVQSACRLVKLLDVMGMRVPGVDVLLGYLGSAMQGNGAAAVARNRCQSVPALGISPEDWLFTTGDRLADPPWIRVCDGKAAQSVDEAVLGNRPM